MVERHRFVVPLTVAMAVLLFALSWLRHIHFGSHAYDLGAYENLFYNLGQTGVPYNAVERGHQWGNHFEVGLLWLYLPYRFAPSPAWLFALQAIAVAMCALPIEAIARARLGNAKLSLLVAIAVWSTPQLILASLYDFHATTVCVLPLAWLAYGIDRDKPRVVFVSALVCLSLREPLALAVAAAGLAWVVAHGRRRLPHAAALITLGTVAFLALVLLVIPHYADGTSFRYVSQYGRLGGSPGAAARFLVEHPLRFLALPFEGRRPVYLLQLAAGAAPLVLLSLRAPRTIWPLIIAAPLLLVQLLNDRWEVWDINFHYGSVVVPLVVLTAALALAELKQRHWVGPALLGALAITTVYAIGWSVFPRLISEIGSFSTVARDARWEALATVPEEVSVCAQQDLAPHLADRPIIHAWPRCDPTDRFIVLDSTGMHISRTIRPAIVAAIVELRGRADVTIHFDRGGAFVAELPPQL